MLLTAGSTAFLAQYLTPIFDDIFIAHRQDLLIWISAGVLSVFIIKGVSEYIGERCLASMGHTLASKLQNDLFGCMVYFDLSFFRDHHEAQCASLFSQDIQVVRETLLQSLTAITRDIFMVLSLVVVLLQKDATLFLGAVCVLPLMAGLLRYCGKRAKHIFARIQHDHGVLQKFFQQVFHQMVMVKAYNTERYEQKRLHQQTMDILHSYKCATRIQAIIHPFMEILGGFAIAGVVIYGGSQVISGSQTTGSFLTFITALFFLYRPMKNILHIHTRLQSCVVCSERIFKMLDMPLTEYADTRKGSVEIFSGNITFDTVSFAYTSSNTVLDNISFVFEENKHYAIVGASGSGKTTLCYLLLQLYRPNQGKILFSGQDAASYSPRWIREHLGFVSQDVILFDTTIQENIAYGAGEASFEDICRAATLAQADAFIRALPEGYQTRVGPHGFKLSGGQRQRLSLARAFLKKSPILLLDEATSALDIKTEEGIRNALCHLNYPCTRISIAHRLSSIQHVECIVVVQNGKIREFGTHQELLMHAGYYTTLWNQATLHS